MDSGPWMIQHNVNITNCEIQLQRKTNKLLLVLDLFDCSCKVQPQKMGRKFVICNLSIYQISHCTAVLLLLTVYSHTVTQFHREKTKQYDQHVSIEIELAVDHWRFRNGSDLCCFSSVQDLLDSWCVFPQCQNHMSL